MPPQLLVLFLTRRQWTEGGTPPDPDVGHDLPPNVAVVRDGLISPIEIPAETDRGARLLGALALPGWVQGEEAARGGMSAKRSAEWIRTWTGLSGPTESRARTDDIGPALEAAELTPSDYLDIDLQGRRSAVRELRNTKTDVDLLEDAEDLNSVRWILDTAQLSGPGQPEVAMGALWDGSAKEEVLARLSDLEALAQRSPAASNSGWRVAVPAHAGVNDAEAEERAQSMTEGPSPRPGPRSIPRYLLAALVGLLLLALVALGVRRWVEEPEPRPAGVVLRADNRMTSGMQRREDQPVPLTTRPVPRCGSRGCNVADSPTWESKQRIDRAVCQQGGERITNGDDGSREDDRNPLLDATRLYYGVALEDGTQGYIAEIWVARDQRGGLGLPPCSQVLPQLAPR